MSDAIRNLDALEWQDFGGGAAFGGRRAKVSAAIGCKKLGCSLYELAPGKRAFPYHAHLANEELYYVLEGSGTLRLDGAEHPVRAGDFVALPPGPHSAHQLVNTGDSPLRFLAVSTMEEPDVVQYPDTGKIGVFAGSAPGGRTEERTVSGFYRAEATVGYLEGEPGA